MLLQEAVVPSFRWCIMSWCMWLYGKVSNCSPTDGPCLCFQGPVITHLAPLPGQVPTPHLLTMLPAVLAGHWSLTLLSLSHGPRDVHTGMTSPISVFNSLLISRPYKKHSCLLCTYSVPSTILSIVHVLFHWIFTVTQMIGNIRPILPMRKRKPREVE